MVNSSKRTNDHRTTLKNVRNLNISSILPSLFSIIIFVITIKLDFFDGNTEANLLAGALIGVLSGIVADRLVAVFYDKVENDRLDQRHSDILEEFISLNSNIEQKILSSFGVQRVGIPHEAYNRMFKNMSDVVSVRNTYLNSKTHNHHGSSSIIDAYKDFLSSSPQKTWHDIISINELHGFRHKQIELDITTENGTHRICLLKRSLPIINFVLLEKIDGSQEVYFGWTYSGQPHEGYIYRSNDKKIIDMFSSYYSELWNSKGSEVWEVPYHKKASSRGPKNNFSVDKVGKWVSISTDDEGDNYAAFEIELRGDAFVKGTVVRDANYGSWGFDHTDITHTPTKIYFEYVAGGRPGASHGFCTYRFKKDGHRDTIDGYMFEDSHCARIYAVRMREADEQISLESPEQVDAIIDGYKDELLKLKAKDFRRSKSGPSKD